MCVMCGLCSHKVGDVVVPLLITLFHFLFNENIGE